MNDNEGWVDEAPRAMPSAAAWMTRPRVVESVRWWVCEEEDNAEEEEEGGGEDERSERE